MGRVSMKELMGRYSVADIPIEYQHNLEELQKRINVVRKAWGKPMIVTSGFRTEADQRRINPKAMRSNHLSGRAVDIADADGLLYAWCVKNEKLLEETGLWMEITGGNWCHFQSVQPRSGRRFFQP